MAELVDALDSGSSGGFSVEVRVFLAASFSFFKIFFLSMDFFFYDFHFSFDFDDLIFPWWEGRKFFKKIFYTLLSFEQNI
jgi:hypothetical protein